MIREVDLASYLPTYLREYNQETVAALQAENPEFRLVWEGADKVLYNEFILTADESGISRFEKILGILPLNEDTLESRRARVQSRWFNEIPYTMKALVLKLITLCGDSDFEIKKDFLHYKITIETNLALYSQIAELVNIIQTIIPANIVVKIINHVLLSEQILLGETIDRSKLQWNYKLGSWILGMNEFATTISEEVLVMPTDNSITNQLLYYIASEITNKVAIIRLNGNIELTKCIKLSTENTAQIQYTISPTQIDVVHKIELLDSEHNVLSVADVYVLVADDTIFTHKIQVDAKEE